MRRRLIAYGLLALPGLITLAPVLFFGQVFADGDAVLQLYPGFQFVQSALAGRDSVVWNPHVLTGFLTAASLMGGWLSWLHQLALHVASVPLAYAWLTWLYFYLTALFTFELVLALRLPQSSALFAGLVAPWVSASFAWAANLTMTPSFPLVPALFYFFLVFSRSRWRTIVAVATAAGLLIGTLLHPAHVQMAVQAVVVAMLWAAFLDLRSRRLRALPGAFLTLAIAAAVSWPQYALVLVAKNFSARVQQGISLAEASGGALLPGDVLSLVFPRLHLPFGLASPGLLYVGAVPLLLLLVSWLGKKTAEYKFFAWLAVLTLAASIKHSPVLWLVHQLPMFAPFRSLVRLMHIGVFAVVVMAAYGLAHLREAGGSDRRVQRIVTWAWRVTVGVVGIILTWSLLWQPTSQMIRNFAVRYFESVFRPEDLTLPKAHYYQVIDRIIDEVGRGTTLSYWPLVAATSALVLACGLLHVWRFRLSSHALTSALVVIAAANLVAVNQSSLRTTSSTALQTPPPPVQYLRSHERSEVRIFTAFAGFTTFDQLDTPHGDDPTENVVLLKNLLSPNIGMLYGVDTFDTYDNLMDDRHSRMLAYLGSDRSLQPAGKLAEMEIPFTEKISRLLERLPLLSAYNVKYLISAYPLEHPALHEVLRWEATRFRIPLYLYENTNVRPRYYLVGNPELRPVLSEEQSWQANFETAAAGTTLIECAACPDAVSGTGTVTPLQQANARYEFLITASTPQYFVFGHNFLPGWRVSIDGNAAPFNRANYLNGAVAVPAGQHRLLFTYAVESVRH